MTVSQDQNRRQAPKRLAVVLVGGVAGVALGLAAVYGIGRLARNVGVDPACAPAVETAKRITPEIRGEVAALAPAKSALKLPQLAFQDASGQQRSLADWRGKTVLLNLWATWCVPCRKEMPALDQLQAKRGNAEFEVLAINIDTRDPAKPRAWLKEVSIDRLGYFADPSAKVFQDLKEAGKAFGMPTTILVDPQGCEVATLAGPAEWASEDALRVIDAALKR